MSEGLASIRIYLEKAAFPLLAALIYAAPAFAGDYYAPRPLRYGNTSSWHFDARNDDRDFRNNGFFPGNFAGNSWDASIGAAGFLESNPYRSAWPYPSEVYFSPAGDQVACVSRRRSSNRVYPVRDGNRNPCARSVH